MKIACTLLLFFIIGAALGQHDQWTASRNDVPTGDEPYSFKVAMKPRNLDLMDQLFWQVSDPDSPFFGRFLTNDQIADLISQPENAISMVEDYLQKESGKFCDVNVKRSIHRDFLFVDTCVAQAEEIFPNLKLSFYRTADRAKKILRSAGRVDVGSNLTFLGVPNKLHDFLTGIYDVTDLPAPMKRSKAEPVMPTTKEWWLPNDKPLTINEVINNFGINSNGITQEALNADNGQVRQAVIEFDHQAFSQSDLRLFQIKYHIALDPISKVIGTEETKPGGEADGDVQVITALAQGAQTWSFVFNSQGSFFDAIETVMSTEGAPKVYSCSWATLESRLGKTMTEALNVQFMKLGLAGFTWLNASGDWGPSLNKDTCDTLDATYPPSSPYVVAVGGLKIDKDTLEEGAWFRSGGGFAKYSPRPKFQEEVVQHYLDNTKLPVNPKGQSYETSGKGFPDVAAYAAYFPCYYEGILYPHCRGTSVAVPQFAGVITMIQIKRYQQGLGPLGPLIQPLYKLKEGVGFDVTLGQTYAMSELGGCNGTVLPGFFAAKGWDPATGLGSPRYDVLLEQLLQLGSQERN